MRSHCITENCFSYFHRGSSFTGKYWSSVSLHIPLAHTDWRKFFNVELSNCLSVDLFLVSFSTSFLVSRDFDFWILWLIYSLFSTDLSSKLLTVLDYSCWTLHLSDILAIRLLSFVRLLVLHLLGCFLAQCQPQLLISLDCATNSQHFLQASPSHLYMGLRITRFPSCFVTRVLSTSASSRSQKTVKSGEQRQDCKFKIESLKIL